ncbi:hypothetical protein ACFVAE_09375 [Microbacterium sp. NPDC057659]|uniref:hypothetical protein n=1 Tax=Microbacterium sp. NPDC057659 TaxID=3346198 RepID=UPI00366EB515
MAKLRRFIKGDIDAKAPRTEVDGYFTEVHANDGTLLLYLYNFSKAGPKPGATPTQSLHFDRESATAFKKVLEDTFGPL